MPVMKMIGANDLLTAAHARSLGFALVTNNTAEFGRVRGLTIENWTLPPRRARSKEHDPVRAGGPARRRVRGSRQISDWTSGCRSRARPDPRGTFVEAEMGIRLRAGTAASPRTEPLREVTRWTRARMHGATAPLAFMAMAAL
jgi:hypothetical protein